MEKQSLSRFVSKYNLSGLVESVKWESKDGSLTTSFISDDKSVLGSVSMKEFEASDSEFGVYDTTKLTKMLSVLGNDVDFSMNDIDGKPVSLKFKDGSTSVNYMLADLSVIPNVPDLKQLPEFDTEIKLDSNFINKFIKAKGALADENNFTFTCGDGKNGSGQIIKEILVANKEATDATLKISSQGLAHISFEVDNYESNYYLVEIQS